MAILAEGVTAKAGRSPLFHRQFLPLEPIEVGGVFKCCHCGAEDVGRNKAPPPHPHSEELIPVRWTLIVAAERAQRVVSLASMRDRRNLGRGGDEPGSPASGARRSGRSS